MAIKDDGLRMSCEELSSLFSDPTWSAKFPPLLTVDQAAALLQIPKNTLYDWSSRGLLDTCCVKVGKHLRIARDRLLNLILNQGIQTDGK